MSDAKPIGHWTAAVVRRHRTWRRRLREIGLEVLDRSYPVLSVLIAVATWPALIALVLWCKFTAADRRARIDGSRSGGHPSGVLAPSQSHREAAGSPTSRAPESSGVRS